LIFEAQHEARPFQASELLARFLTCRMIAD
jgi:hypothetical protein